ncbi:MAG: hypothetical protein WCP97_08095 [bacterium]
MPSLCDEKEYAKPLERATLKTQIDNRLRASIIALLDGHEAKLDEVLKYSCLEPVSKVRAHLFRSIIAKANFPLYYLPRDEYWAANELRGGNQQRGVVVSFLGDMKRVLKGGSKGKTPDLLVVREDIVGESSIFARRDREIATLILERLNPGSIIIVDQMVELSIERKLIQTLGGVLTRGSKSCSAHYHFDMIGGARIIERNTRDRVIINLIRVIRTPKVEVRVMRNKKMPHEREKE